MSLEDLKKRLNYYGGKKAQDRLIRDKAWSLSKALLYSYQAATAILPDSREFRCLINPNKLTLEEDDKIISIQFKDVCLNHDTNLIEDISLKVGDIIQWKENQTYWLIYLQYLQEKAYFRGAMRLCNEEVMINNIPYKVYLRGPSEKNIEWVQESHSLFNELNYSLKMYISVDENTKQNLKRFSIIKINNNPWEIQTVDSVTNQGILIVYLKEYFSQEIDIKPEENFEIPEPEDTTKPYIKGEAILYPYDIKEYTIQNLSGGKWITGNDNISIISSNDNKVTIEVTTGKSGKTKLIYKTPAEEVSVDLIINSL